MIIFNPNLTSKTKNQILTLGDLGRLGMLAIYSKGYMVISLKPLHGVIKNIPHIFRT